MTPEAYEQGELSRIIELAKSIGVHEVLVFDALPLFTAPMRHNRRMGEWAYLYQDVSWILTLGWTALILSVVVITDKLLSNWKEWKRFWVYLAVLTVSVCFLEAIVVNIGIRSYAPEVLASLSGVFMFNVPLEALTTPPSSMSLVISFYKYWCFLIDDQILIPIKRRKWLRGLFITALGVFLFEVMIEPMVSNERLPQWSFIFHDISILLTGLWIIVIVLGRDRLDSGLDYFICGASVDSPYIIERTRQFCG